jgi:hypothetical protein
MKHGLPWIALLTTAIAGAAEFHVAPTGSDANAGNAATPFATIPRALEAVRKSKATHPGEANRIVLHGGEYAIRETIVLTPDDSGQAGKPLVIEAAPGEKPVLTSARPITGWRPAPDETPGLAPEVRGKVFVAEVPQGWRFHFLYVDDQPQHVASLCKPDQHWRSWPNAVKVGPLEAAGQLLTLPAGQLDGLPSNGDLEMNLMPVQYWNTLSVLRDVDARANTVRRHSKNPTTFWRDRFDHKEGQYNLQNALKFLTKPGEWCVDSAKGRVFYHPENGSPAGKRIWAPALCRLVEFKGTDERRVHDIAIRGIRFSCTDRLPEDQWPDDWVKRQAELPDGMVFLEGVEDCEFSGNTLNWSGSYGIAMQGYARRVRITGNEIGFPGCGGVLLQGYGPGTTDVNRDNVIRRNYIHHTGNGGYLHSAAVTLYQSGHNDISLNWIANVPYAGIQIAGAAWSEFGTGKPAGAWDSYGDCEAMYKPRWQELPGGREGKFTRDSFKTYLHSRGNRIRHNILTDYLARMSDGGALYSWGCGLDNQWEGNLLRRTNTQPREQWCFALYMDDYVDGALLKDNIAWHKGDKTINKGANQWPNNIVQPDKPAGFEAALAAILAEATKEGGIVGDPSVDEIGKLPPDPMTAQPAKPMKPGAWIEVASVSELRGPRLDDKKTYIGWITGGHSAVFGPYQFERERAGTLEVEVGVDPKYVGGKIHVRHLPDGPDLASFTLASTGGFESWKTLSEPITLPAGKHPLFLVFEGGHAVCSLKRIRFSEK